MPKSLYSKNVNSGKWIPNNREKYKGDINNICFRSGYELKFMQWCDRTKAVVSWASEELAIPYISPVDGNWHRYFPDFIVQIKKESSIKTYIIEIKPKAFTRPPKPKKRKSKRFIAEVTQFSVNQIKWEFAKQYAEQHGMEFLLITEDDLNIG